MDLASRLLQRVALLTETRVLLLLCILLLEVAGRCNRHLKQNLFHIQALHEYSSAVLALTS